MTTVPPADNMLPALPAGSRRLRIAVLNRIFRPTGGGAERYSIALVEQLSSRHEIHVFAQTIDHACPGVTYHRIPTPCVRPRWINQLWFALATWWVTRKGFDVVHSHENTWHGQVQTVHVVPIKYSLLVDRQGWRFALRWLKIVTSPRLLTYLGLEHFRYRLEGKRHIALASQRLRSVMAQAYPIAVKALSVVTPGVMSVSPPASVHDKQAARSTLGLPERGYCILFVGNDYRKKGLPTLLRALARLTSECFLAVVGNPAQIADFRDEIAASGLSDRVYFLGALNSVELAYAAADCLAHPTLEDTFAMVVLEAMAHGLPVVVSGAAYCGIAELLVDESDALILDDPRGSERLASALTRVLFDANLRARLHQNGTNFARQYLWSEIAMQQERIYYAVI